MSPLGVYIHWPYCARICPYCDFNVYRSRPGRDAEEALVAAMRADLAAYRAWTGPRALVSIFFGGGTPSLMAPAHVARLISTCCDLWTAEAGLEISLEANPTDAEAARFEGLRTAGVTRLSLGLQSLSDKELKFLGRDHSAAEGRRASALALRLFDRCSADLIYALPGQQIQAWSETLNEVVKTGFSHISPYQLTIEAGTAFDRATQRGAWRPCEEDVCADLYDLTQAQLSAAGFEAYEVSNHAKGQSERARHNLLYWTGKDYVGVGPGAHGRLSRDGVRFATQAPDRPADYIAARLGGNLAPPPMTPLTPVEAAEERLLMGLRLVEGVSWAEVAALGLRPASPVITALVDEGHLRIDAIGLRTTEAGRKLLDHLTRRLVLASAR